MTRNNLYCDYTLNLIMLSAVKPLSIVCQSHDISIESHFLHCTMSQWHYGSSGWKLVDIRCSCKWLTLARLESARFAMFMCILPSLCCIYLYTGQEYLEGYWIIHHWITRNVHTKSLLREANPWNWIYKQANSFGTLNQQKDCFWREWDLPL